jgi:hypothetical protein
MERWVPSLHGEYAEFNKKGIHRDIDVVVFSIYAESQRTKIGETGGLIRVYDRAKDSGTVFAM